MRAKRPRIRVLLADEQEPAARTPPAAEPAAAENAPTGTAVQHRDKPAAAAPRERAKGNDPELTLQIGMRLLKFVRFEVDCGAVAQFVHLRDIRFTLGHVLEVLYKKDPVAGRLIHSFA